VEAVAVEVPENMVVEVAELVATVILTIMKPLVVVALQNLL
jgi:hypothetical protein